MTETLFVKSTFKEINLYLFSSFIKVEIAIVLFKINLKHNSKILY